MKPTSELANFRVKSRYDLHKLKPGCSVKKPENLVPDLGCGFCIHSPFSNTYYNSEITEYTDWEILDQYISEGNVYFIKI